MAIIGKGFALRQNIIIQHVRIVVRHKVIRSQAHLYIGSPIVEVIPDLALTDNDLSFRVDRNNAVSPCNEEEAVIRTFFRTVSNAKFTDARIDNLLGNILQIRGGDLSGPGILLPLFDLFFGPTELLQRRLVDHDHTELAIKGYCVIFFLVVIISPLIPQGL